MLSKETNSVLLDCPVCGRRCPEPFERGSLQPYTHTYNSNCEARFVVSIDPTGDDHWFDVLEQATEFSVALDEMREAHQRRVKRAVFLDQAQRLGGCVKMTGLSDPAHRLHPDGSFAKKVMRVCIEGTAAVARGGRDPRVRGR